MLLWIGRGGDVVGGDPARRRDMGRRVGRVRRPDGCWERGGRDRDGGGYGTGAGDEQDVGVREIGCDRVVDVGAVRADDPLGRARVVWRAWAKVQGDDVAREGAVWETGGDGVSAAG